MKKTLILTSTVPGSGGVGDIYLKNIISGFDKSLFVRCSIVKQQSTKFDSTWEGVESKVIQIYKSHYPGVSSYYLTRFLKNNMPGIVNELILLIKRMEVDKIWVTLSSPELIILAKALSENTNVKIYSTIWDVPEYLLKNNHFDPITCKFVKREFINILNYSEKISVIDEGMKMYLPVSLHDKSVIVRNGVSYTDFDLNDHCVNVSNVIKIVFAGSIYAKKEWNALVRSLVSCDFTINGKEVELICIGKLPRYGIFKDDRIDFKPFMPNSEVLKILSECDIGYVPYWFNSRNRLIVSTSFPGKIASYLSVSLKVMFHGPDFASVKLFLDKYEVGKCCHSLEEKHIIKTLSDIDSLYVDEHQLSMAKEIFSNTTMINSFKKFIF